MKRKASAPAESIRPTQPFVTSTARPGAQPAACLSSGIARWPRGIRSTLPIIAALALAAGCTTAPPAKPAVSKNPHAGLHATAMPREFWIDLIEGDEAAEPDVLADLATAGVIFVGEYHTIARQHEVQLGLLQALFQQNVPLVLCLEQLEAPDQPAVDRYCRGELDFAGLVKEIDWEKKWRNYEDYRPLCEFARQHRIPIRGLNARAEVIRAVYRGGGIAHLAADSRAQLPPEVLVDDPVYEKLENRELAVHAGTDPAKLRPMFEAQVARDEAMAANVVAARTAEPKDGQPRTAFVVLGAGHMRYGLGTAARVRRRDPQLVERLVLVSESGQLVLTAAEKAGQREVDETHADMRAIGRAPADYLRVLPKTEVTLPPGHPPLAK